MNIRSAILESEDGERVPFLTGWKGPDGEYVKVWIRTLSVEEIENHANSMRGKDGTPDVKRSKGAVARLIAKATVDSEGNRVFTAADVERLQKKAGKHVAALGNAINELNGFDDDDQELMGNSDADQNDSSSIDSPGSWED